MLSTKDPRLKHQEETGREVCVKWARYKGKHIQLCDGDRLGGSGEPSPIIAMTRMRTVWPDLLIF